MTNLSKNKNFPEKHNKTSQNAGFWSFNTTRHTLKKCERLRSRKEISHVFSKGESLSEYPLLLLYTIEKSDCLPPIRAAFTVSKKKFSRAIDRNKIKRLLREAYRLNKKMLYQSLPKNYSYSLVFIYIGKEIESFQLIEKKTIDLFSKLA